MTLPADHAISGRTALAAVIGDPVTHSLSPAVQNAAFRACGIDAVFAAFTVAAGRAAEAIAATRTLGLVGLSVTMPHKEAAATAVDRCSDTAARLRAVNTVVRRGDRMIGENTDGQGFLDSLQRSGGPDPAGARCVVAGAGGAARAVVLALADAGAAEVVVVNRTAARAQVAAALAGARGRVGAGPEIADADLVVQATPSGMAGHGAGAVIPVALLGPGQTVVDLVYDPIETALVHEARARGARATGGLGMLVHQAARAFTLWTGVEAPVEAMRAAAEAQIAARTQSRPAEA